MAEPTIPMTVHDLSAKTGEKVRTIRYWVQQGVLPRPAFHGRATTYSRTHELIILAVRALRSRGRVSTADLKKRLAKAPIAELEVLSGVRRALPDAPPPPPPAPTYPAALWSRVALLPGLELSVRADAPEVVRRIAADIFAHYGAPPA